MKYKLLATLLTAIILVVPMLGFWHPPVIPGCTSMGTLVNGADPKKNYNFTEPVDGYCEDFTVEVWVYDAVDLYGYDVFVDYDNVTFNFVSAEVHTIFDAQAPPIINGLDTTKGDLDTGYYHLVVTAVPPSAGLSGDFKLATITFHIMNDVCPCDKPLFYEFSIEAKLSNSCSGIIEVCKAYEGHGYFNPVIPSIWIEPEELVSSIVGEKNTITIYVKDVVKMKDFFVSILWNMYQHPSHGGSSECGLAGMWTTLLYTTKKDVVLNTDVFNITDASIAVGGPKCGVWSATNQQGYVNVGANTLNKALVNLTYPSETLWLFKVTFTKCDPWYCGAQPRYDIDEETHEVLMENATTPIYFDTRYTWISGPCAVYGQPMAPDCLDVTDALYTFAPIPGDLDGSGHVDTADLMILAAYYGITPDCTIDPTWMPPNGFPYFYDLNHDGAIDIYDIVIVAKNFCRTVPGT